MHCRVAVELIASNFPIEDRISLEDFVPGHLKVLFGERSVLEILLLWIQTGGIHRELLVSAQWAQQLRIETLPPTMGIIAVQQAQALVVDKIGLLFGIQRRIEIGHGLLIEQKVVEIDNAIRTIKLSCVGFRELIEIAWSELIRIISEQICILNRSGIQSFLDDTVLVQIPVADRTIIPIQQSLSIFIQIDSLGITSVTPLLQPVPLHSCIVVLENFVNGWD
jgi:hypothetical protein